MKTVTILRMLVQMRGWKKMSKKQFKFRFALGIKGQQDIVVEIVDFSKLPYNNIDEMLLAAIEDYKRTFIEKHVEVIIALTD